MEIVNKINDVREFWEKNPLWTGESDLEVGSLEFYQEHQRVYIEDCFGGKFDNRFLPYNGAGPKDAKIIDVGCGIGFWLAEFGLRGYTNITGVDLTKNALELSARRLQLLGLTASLSQQNAEEMDLPSGEYDHVNCQGVIHHTPRTEMAVSEIARILKPGGTAVISVYYRNPILRLWPLFHWSGWVLAKLGGGLKGRGREQIFLQSDVNEIVRLYDGADNPIGKSYTAQEFINIVSPHFEVKETFLHFFPARSLPFRIPRWLHTFLDRKLGFLIYVTLVKR